MAINIHDPELNNIESKIKDAWFYLLSFYDGICLNVGDVESVLNRNDSADQEHCPCTLPSSLGIGSEEAVTLPMIHKNRECGYLKVVCRGEKENQYQAFLDYTPRAYAMRKIQSNSSLLPDGLIYISHQHEIWTNSIASEILCSLEMEASQLVATLFTAEGDSVEKLMYNRSVLLVEKTLLQFEITGIKIPILAGRNCNESAGIFCIISDSTVIHQKDKELVSKSAMILEIHHRVKNNLQTISSLLRLQMRRLNSRAVEKAFLESINRISSIAIIHEELSKIGLDEINLKETIKSIMEMILGNMVAKTKDITGEISGDTIYINANKASTLSLCVTELIQNAVEHAFTFRNKGSIHVHIEEKDDSVTISVEDDGTGFNPQKSKNSLGLEIIRMITEETLKGQFYIEGHTYGTNSKIVFPLQSIK